jgi:hypothetical protein
LTVASAISELQMVLVPPLTGPPSVFTQAASVLAIALILALCGLAHVFVAVFASPELIFSRLFTMLKALMRPTC